LLILENQEIEGLFVATLNSLDQQLIRLFIRGHTVILAPARPFACDMMDCDQMEWLKVRKSGD
jgi:hypothetical protein